MLTVSFRKSLFFVLALGSLSACDSGDLCQESTQRFSLDQKTPSGVSGQEFSKGVIGNHAVQLSAAGPQTGYATPTLATLAIEIPPASVFSHIASVYVPCKPGGNCDSDVKLCHDKFSLPVRARLWAKDGSIDETWEGTLTGLDPKDPDLQSWPKDSPYLVRVTLSAKRPADSFKGALKIPSPKLTSNSKLVKHEVGLSVSFQAGKVVRGEVLNETETHIDGPGDPGRGIGQLPFLSISPAPAT